MTPTTDITGDAKPYSQLTGPATRYLLNGEKIVAEDLPPNKAAFWTEDGLKRFRNPQPVRHKYLGAPA